VWMSERAQPHRTPGVRTQGVHAASSNDRDARVCHNLAELTWPAVNQREFEEQLLGGVVSLALLDCAL